MDAAPLLPGKEVADSPEVRTAWEAWGVFVVESKKLWKIAVPIVFYILCLYGINSTTQVFAGHIGNVQLAAVAIALSVISGLSFGLLMSTRVLPSKESKTKREVLVWTTHMDNVFIESMLFQHREGNHQDGIFSSCSYNDMLKDMNEKFPSMNIKRENLKNRLKTIKQVFSKCYDIFKSASNSGFAWNPESKKWEAEPEVWEILIQIGMGSALETLCGQAYGAGEVEMLGVYMQRSWIILFVTSLLLCPFYLYATPILKLLGQEDAIADAAGQFTRHIIPQMFALALNFPTQKFLQAQSKVNVMAWMSGTTLLCHVGLLWLFIYVFGWGMNGAAAAYNISLWLLALAQTVYVMRWCKEGWRGFSWDAFKGIWAFVRLSIASAVMICLEIWYMMILVLLTGHLSDAQIAVGSISICMNLNGWESTMFVGVNAAISIRISNELGSGRPRTAMYSVIVVIITSLAIGLLCMVGLLALRDYFPVIFTSDKDMQRAVSKMAGLLGLTMVLNSIQPVISGVAVGGGWQALVAYINLGCYYVFGLPVGFVFGYLIHWGVEGIWIGMLCGIALQTLILLLVIWKTNWRDEASQASERVRLWGGQDDTIKSIC